MPLSPENKEKLKSIVKGAAKAAAGAAGLAIANGLGAIDLAALGPIWGPIAYALSSTLVNLVSKFTVDK